MNRRDFLACAVAALAAPRRLYGAADDSWRTFEVVTRVEILRAPGAARAWVPLPLPDATSWQRSLGNRWTGNVSRAVVRTDARYGARMLYAEWAPGEQAPLVEVTSRVMTRDRTADLSWPASKTVRLSARERQLYLAPTSFIPTDGLVRDTATPIVARAHTDVEKARAIYDWVVENTFRDPAVKGCGLGDIRGMLATRSFGGKCADLNALFVGLARAAGVPARDVYGIRVAPSALGYKSLGAASATITRAQHCRAEFYADGIGWVPVDPADVRKVVLEEPPGKLAVDDPKVHAARARLLGSWEMNWMAYNTGHDIPLPGSAGATLPFLMYPQAESDGQRLDPLEPDAFRYTITAHESPM
jgi:transglutaminase-like putative cysteine protease